MIHDVAELTARIGAAERWQVLQRLVAHERRIVATARATSTGARARLAAATATVGRAGAAAATARADLGQLALAAYTGSTQAPEVGAVGAAGDGLFGDRSQRADDADVMVSVIVADTEKALAASERAVSAARSAEESAAARAAPTRRVIAAAEQATTAAEAQMRAAVAAARSTSPVRTAKGGPTILGPTIVDAAQLAGWYASTGEQRDTTVGMARLAADYLASGRATGVRADVAFAQSVVETGYFSFPSGGQLVGRDNNFAGIGACDSCAHGWSFRSAGVGVGTQLELLEVYAATHPVATPLLHGQVGIGGCCRTWMSLSGHWATDLAYGTKILSVYDRILRWVLPRELAASHIG